MLRMTTAAVLYVGIVASWVFAVCRAGACQGDFAVEGLKSKSYLAGGGGFLNNASLTMQHSSGYSLMNACNGDWNAKDFFELKLLGKTFEFTVDLSGVGCACNLAVYLISAPAVDQNGNPSRG